MENVYKSCPTFDVGRFLIRLVAHEDAADLLEVYSEAESSSISDIRTTKKPSSTETVACFNSVLCFRHH